MILLRNSSLELKKKSGHWPIAGFNSYPFMKKGVFVMNEEKKTFACYAGYDA